jgi:broad specificity phosphatase PhoE
MGAAGHVWMVRHGETEWTVSKKHTGRTDIPLTVDGESGARALAPVLGQRTFALVMTSPLQRARRTAELAGFADAKVDDRLRELNYGDYEGRTTAEIRDERPDWFLWRDGTPGGESMEDVGRRADSVIAELAGVDGDVLLFGHGHFSRVLGARLLGLPPSGGGLLMLSPASISVVGSEHGQRAIKTWNWQAEI